MAQMLSRRQALFAALGAASSIGAAMVFDPPSASAADVVQEPAQPLGNHVVVERYGLQADCPADWQVLDKPFPFLAYPYQALALASPTVGVISDQPDAGVRELRLPADGAFVLLLASDSARDPSDAPLLSFIDGVRFESLTAREDVQDGFALWTQWYDAPPYIHTLAAWIGQESAARATFEAVTSSIRPTNAA